MATGPEHYREAEEWLTDAKNNLAHDVLERAVSAALAQAHATLALAAATALASTGVGEADLGEWSALICEPDDPYAELTIHDVMDADELAEDERAAEAHLDALDEARAAELGDDYEPGDEHEYEDDEGEDDL